jgi:hypothetical protein
MHRLYAWPSFLSEGYFAGVASKRRGRNIRMKPVPPQGLMTSMSSATDTVAISIYLFDFCS